MNMTRILLAALGAFVTYLVSADWVRAVAVAQPV